MKLIISKQPSFTERNPDFMEAIDNFSMDNYESRISCINSYVATISNEYVIFLNANVFLEVITIYFSLVEHAISFKVRNHISIVFVNGLFWLYMVVCKFSGNILKHKKFQKKFVYTKEHLLLFNWRLKVKKKCYLGLPPVQI